MLHAKREWRFWKNRPCIRTFSNIANTQNAIIRKEHASPPPALRINQIVHTHPTVFNVSAQSASELTQFWNAYYATSDWKIQYSESTVFDMLSTNQAQNTIIGVRNPEGDLIGTVASIRLNGKFMTNAKEHEQSFFKVECLVLHPQIRGRGVAGWLLAWLDHLTSKNGPVVHVWIRESFHKQQRLPKTHAKPFVRMNTIQISLISIATRRHEEEVTQLQWHAFKNILNQIPFVKDSQFDLTYIPNEPKDITCWRVEISEYPSNAFIVAIKDTHKLCLRQKKPIFDVVFTCFVRIRPGNMSDLADPFWVDETHCPHIRECIEAAAFTQKCDLLTVSDNSICGDPYLYKWPSVRVNRSKKKIYMYNWTPQISGTIVWPN